MNHRSGLRKLNITDSAHRRAMFRNMSNSLILHERIRTTAIRAKELRRILEPLVTISKTSTVANRRLVFSRLRDKNSVAKLFDDIGIRCANRPGGYLRILKCGYRRGDNAMMALVEFVDKREDDTKSAPVAPATKAKKSVKEKPAAKPAAKSAEKPAAEIAPPIEAATTPEPKDEPVQAATAATTESTDADTSSDTEKSK